MKTFWLWYAWRRLVVQAYLASYTDDPYLTEDIANQARTAELALERHRALSVYRRAF